MTTSPSFFVGLKFGKLTVVMQCAERLHGSIVWLCKCECGGEKKVSATHLRNGHTVSCGCARGGRPIHGAASEGKWTPTYKSWRWMINRCRYRNKFYSDRGIKICSRWKHSFNNFLADMGERPEGMTLDRIDSNGDYCPENCQWATMADQVRNRRSNRMVTFKGETLPMVVWAERVSLPYITVATRLDRGWTPERALTQPHRYEPERWSKR